MSRTLSERTKETSPKEHVLCRSEQKVCQRNKDFTEGTKTLPKEQRRTSELDSLSIREMQNIIRQCTRQGLVSLFPFLLDIGTNKSTLVRVLLLVLICFEMFTMSSPATFRESGTS